VPCSLLTSLQGGLADHKIPALPAGLTADYLCDVLDLPATADTTFTFVDLLTYRLSAARTQCEDGALAGDWKNLAVTAQRALGNLATGDAATTEKVVSSRAMVGCAGAMACAHMQRASPPRLARCSLPSLLRRNPTVGPSHC